LNKWDSFGLKGKVKSYTETNYYVKGDSGKWEKDKIHGDFGYDTVTFNPSGEFIKNKNYNLNNELNRIVIPSRNANNKLIALTTINNKKDTISQTIISWINDTSFTYEVYSNTDNQAYKNYSSNKFTTITNGVGTTNGKGLKTNVSFFEFTKGINYSTKYEYNSLGDLETESSQVDNKERKSTYTYLMFDSNKNWTKRQYCLVKGHQPGVKKTHTKVVLPN
jgi:hypothetical protein